MIKGSLKTTWGYGTPHPMASELSPFLPQNQSLAQAVDLGAHQHPAPPVPSVAARPPLTRLSLASPKSAALLCPRCVHGGPGATRWPCTGRTPPALALLLYTPVLGGTATPMLGGLHPARCPGTAWALKVSPELCVIVGMSGDTGGWHWGGGKGGDPCYSMTPMGHWIPTAPHDAPGTTNSDPHLWDIHPQHATSGIPTQCHITTGTPTCSRTRSGAAPQPRSPTPHMTRRLPPSRQLT